MTKPLPPAVNLYQTVLIGGTALPGAQFGTGSVASVVAAKLSTVSENVIVVMFLAAAKSSFTGRVLCTVNNAAFDGPPPGGGLTTVTSFTPPKANSVCESVAVICVAETKVVFITPVVDPFQLIFELELKFVPVTMM